MLLLEPDQILIPYGTPRPPGDRLAVTAESGGRLAVDCHLPHVVASAMGEAGEALRLSGGRYEGLSPPDPRVEISPADLLAALRDNLLRFCDQWRKGQRQFIEQYFAFVVAEVETHRDALTERLRPFGELYRTDDWLFSAPRPIPQAWLSLDPGAGAAAYAPENLVMVDIAFRTGEGLLAIVPRGLETPDPKKAAAHDALRAAGVVILEIPNASLMTTPPEGFGALLPDSFRHFWEREPIPSGPFKPGLPESLAGSAER